MKNELHIYPTSRIIRQQQSLYKQQDGFIPSFMSMDEFINSIVVIDNLAKVDTIERILYLQEASNFEEFDKLKLDRALVKFFTKSDAIFKFFEELSVERVGFDTLRKADAYVEFDEHIMILEHLYYRYKNILETHFLTDRAFIPNIYNLNQAFISNFDTIDIYIYGYLSHFELDILEKVASYTNLYLHIDTTNYNVKMIDRIKQRFDIKLKENVSYKLSLSSCKVVEAYDIQTQFKAHLYNVEHRLEQIPLALIEIQKMIDSGIEPQNIVLLLPDESSKEYFKLYDVQHNLNFAMGNAYKNTKIYKLLNLIYKYIQTRDVKYKQELDLYKINFTLLDDINNQIGIDKFFIWCDDIIGAEEKAIKFLEYQESFKRIFAKRKFLISEWLFLWIKKLDTLSLDDISGGKITAMGILESRGMRYEGVVIVDFNDTIVPSIPSKDQFLNTQVRKFANLPTKQDREFLQKHYYQSIIQKAKYVSIIYTTANNQLPSKFLYELKLGQTIPIKIDAKMFYSGKSYEKSDEEIVVAFDPSNIQWSSSKLKTYLECKQKFYYRYIQHILPKPSEDINPGSILHKVLQKVYSNNHLYQTQEELFKAISINLNYILEDDHLGLYHKTLWLEKLKPFIKHQILHFKQGFSVIHTEKCIKGKIVGLDFVGIVDRIDQNSTHTLVIDYKTGSIKDANRTKNLDKLSDFQMSIYHMLLSSKYPNLELYFIQILEDGNLISIKELETKNQLLLEHLDAIKKQTTFSPTKCDDLSLCKYCDYTLLCGRGEYL